MSIQLNIPAERIKSKSLSDKFWGSEPKHNFYARAKNVVISGNLDRKLLMQIQSEYDGDLVNDFADQWRELLKAITYEIAIDGVIDADERAFFKEYIAIFNIPTDEASRIYRAGARDACLKLLSEVYEDGKIEDHEIERIKKIAEGFGLREFDVEAHIAAQLPKLVQARFDDMVKDQMISDDEWEEFTKNARDMRVLLDNSPETMTLIEIGRNHWRAKYGQPKPLQVQDVNTKTNENVYLDAEAIWYEDRVDNGETYKKQIRSGRLLLTNKRLMMIATEGDNKAIAWDDVHGVRQISSAVFDVEKVTGKSPTINLSSADEVGWLAASTIAHRLCRGELE